MSKNITTYEKGNFLLILAAIVLIVVGLWWWLMQNGTGLPSQTAQGPSIQNSRDLDAAAKDLDSQDLNQIDSGMSQFNSETSF